MPDLLAHYTLSLLVATRVTSLRRALPLALAGLAPDIDALLQLHRWATHSLALTAIAALALIPAARLKAQPTHTKYVALALTLTALHIALDILTAPTPILWPLTGKSYQLDIQLTGTITNNHVSLNPTIQITSTPTDFTPHPTLDAPIITPTGTTLTIATLTALLAEHLHRKQ